MVVDVHTHFIPPGVVEEAPRNPAWGVSAEQRDGATWLHHEQGFAYPLDPAFAGDERKLEDMTRRGIDLAVMSLSPTLFLYWIDAGAAAAFAQFANDALAAAVRASGGRLAGLASLPMQAPGDAAAELRRCVYELGMRGAHIGSSVEGEPLDDPRFEPVLAAAEELGVPLVLHPYYVGDKPGLEDFYLTNLYGNPADTALAAARLILSGALDRHPDLDVVLVHAGGFLPYQIGRLDHGWSVRPEARRVLERPPSAYLGRFHFDTITHHDGALRWLLELVGDERVLLGTDLPYDMGDADPVARLERVAPTREAHDRVAGLNATVLFGADPVAG